MYNNFIRRIFNLYQKTIHRFLSMSADEVKDKVDRAKREIKNTVVE